MPVTSSEASKHLSTIKTAAEPVKVKADPELGAPSMTSMTSTEKTSQANTSEGPSNPCVDAVSFKEATDVEKSPVTETDLSEPKSGITTASYRTGASSPSFSIPDQKAFPLQQRASFGNKEDRAPVTHAQAVQAYSFLNFAYLTKEIKDVDELLIVGMQDPQEDHINIGPSHKSTSMWADKVAESCSSKWLQVSHDPTDTTREAAAPSRLQPPKDMDTGHVFANALPREPLAKASSTPVYNPLAAEWSPMNQRKNIGKMPLRSNYALEITKDVPQVGQPRSGRPHLTVAVEKLPPSAPLEQTEHLATSKSEKGVHQLKLPTDDSHRMTTAYGEKYNSTATVAGVINDSLKNTNEEPSHGGVYTARQMIAPPSKINSNDRPTLAQRRAGRQFAHAQTRFSQAASSAVKPPPASLCIAQEPSDTNQANPARSAPFTGFHPGQPQFISHSSSLTWKRLPNSDLDNPSIHPEYAKWIKAEQGLLRMGLIKRFPAKEDGGSYVVPKNFEQWLKFRADRTEDLLLEGAANIDKRNSEVEAASRARQSFPDNNCHELSFDNHGQRKIIRIGPAMGGKEYHDGRSTILAHKSIWSPWYVPTDDRPQAQWPCIEEMKEEGDERHTSAFGRFLALPRVPGNPTVVWKVKAVIPALPFDEVWKVPNKDTWVDLHGQKIDDFQGKYMGELVGQALLDAIDS